jgi:hypothetical protein
MYQVYEQGFDSDPRLQVLLLEQQGVTKKTAGKKAEFQ